MLVVRCIFLPKPRVAIVILNLEIHTPELVCFSVEEKSAKISWQSPYLVALEKDSAQGN